MGFDPGHPGDKHVPNVPNVPDDPGDQDTSPGERTGRGRPGRRKALLRVALGASALGLVVLLGLVVTNVVVTRAADGVAYDAAEQIPHRGVAMVFGAGLFGSEPSPALQDRIDAAVDLYHRGVVDHLLMTGDNSRPDYDEVTAMRDAAIEAGVPGEAITRDYAGFSTYDSCIRARDVFGVRGAVLVTQDYHLPRALLTCRELGIDAVGLRVPDWQYHPERLDFAYPDDMARSYMLREWLARTKALADVKVLHPEPELGGEFVGLTET